MRRKRRVVRRRRKTIYGRGIKRPYVNKRNRLMLGSGKKRKGGALPIGALISAFAPAAADLISKTF